MLFFLIKGGISVKEKFPTIKAGYIFNKFKGNKKIVFLSKKTVEIDYPCRLDAMAINPAAVCYNDSMVFELKFNGFSNVEISKLLGLSLSKINRIICKIKFNLRKTN